MRAVIGELLAAEQLGDDRDGLFEHLLAFLGRGPLRARDLLVQRLAGTDAEVEPAAGQQTRGGSGLRDDRPVNSYRRAGQAVVMGRLVTWEMAPMTDQTKLDCPCSSSHGW
jgi:hypothetical protein